MSVETFKLTFTLLSDLHAGSGLGGADVDAVLERDVRGLPTVRWTHMRGLLQQALVDRQRAMGLDSSQLLNELFGTPLAFGKSPGRSAVRGTSLRVRGNTARVKVYVSSARQPGSRVPEDDTLRRVEYLQAGTVLESLIQVPKGKKLIHLNDGKTAAEFLKVLLRRVDCLGKGRTKGDGRICMEFAPIEEAPQTDQGIGGVARPVNDWQHYRLAIRALDPACLAVTLAPGNLIPGTSFISQSGTFGLLAAAALQDDEKVARMFFDGRIEPGASYPLGSMKQFDVAQADALPYPLSYQSAKPEAQAEEWPWWMSAAAPRAPQDVLANRTGEKLKRPGMHTYLVSDDGGKTWARNDAHLGIRLRNNAGEVQRGFRAEKALFSQEEIAEDTVFLCKLRVQATDSDALQAFEGWLEKRIRLGEWLFAGRGGTPVRIEQASRVGLPAGTANEIGTTIRLFLETDLIARRSAQSFHTQLDRECLEDVFSQGGLDVQSAAIANIDDLSEPTIVHGFNVMTGAKRLPAIAIRRGSAAVLTMSSKEDADSLRKLLEARQFEGLGERCAEGYGRFRIDFAPGVCTTVEKPSKLAGPSDEEALLCKVQALLDKHEGCLKPELGFSATRLQALRHAVRHPGAFKDWSDAADRAIKRAKKQTSESLLKEIRLLQEKAAAKEGSPDDSVLRLLERFAVEAAKHVQRAPQQVTEGEKREKDEYR